MKIEIEIPESWKNSKFPMVCITADNFYYSTDLTFHGIQSQFGEDDKDKEAILESECDKISRSIINLINNKLI